MRADTRFQLSRRGLLATVAGLAGAVVAGGLARADRALSAGHVERVFAPEGTRESRSASDGGSSALPSRTLSFSAQDGGEQRTVTVGPDGLHSERRGHWSRRSVTIDGTVRAIGGGAEAAAPGPMIVGEGDTMGVYGSARADGPGVMGRGTVGVEAIGVTGVRATGERGPGIEARGERGGAFVGSLAQVRLEPGELPTHPASGEPGDLFVDSARRLWFCRGGSSWSQLA